MNGMVMFFIAHRVSNGGYPRKDGTGLLSQADWMLLEPRVL